MSSKFSVNKSKFTYTAIISLALILVMSGIQLYERSQRYEIPPMENTESAGQESAGDTGEIPYSNRADTDEDAGAAQGESVEAATAEIIIHIAGEVKNPAVITIQSGSRLYEAVAQVGGLTENADQTLVNLAQELVDGAQYIIPAKGTEGASGSVTNLGEQKGNAASDKININTADEGELQRLDGVGPVLAKRIIEYREAQGGFKNITDLLDVKGIGEAKYDAIKEHVSCK